MRRLLLMRHAKSSWTDDVPDHDRPLNDRGLAAAPRMGRWMVEQGTRPDEVIASTAIRACTTAQLVADEFDDVPHVQTTRTLYMPSIEDIIEVVSGAHGPQVLVVCHNPGVSAAASMLGGSPVSMSTAAVAVIDFDVPEWSDLLVETSGSLHALWLVRDLPDE